MALFGTKKNTSKTAKKSATKQKAGVRSVLRSEDLASIIVRPRVTEKAVRKSEDNVYTFEVRGDATKYDVRSAVEKLWGVRPVRVNTVTMKPRSYMSRGKGRTVSEKGFKKAYVYLKKGDSISF